MGSVAVTRLEVVIRRALLIVNPASRRGARDRRRVEIALAARGVRCDTRITTGPGHATVIARGAGADYDALFTLGGDGTIMEALAGLADSPIPIGALAAGTGNLLVRALGVPLNPVRAARAMCVGHVRTIDLAQLGTGGQFAVAAGVGVDVSMIQRTPAALKRQLGVAAYTLIGVGVGFAAAVRGATFQARIIVDGTHHDLDAMSVLVANVSRVVSGRITLAPGGAADDGWLDVVVYSPRNLWQALRVGWRMLRGTFPDDGLVTFYRGRHIRVVTHPLRRSQADGELLPAGELDVRVLPGAGRFLVPSSS